MRPSVSVTANLGDGTSQATVSSAEPALSSSHAILPACASVTEETGKDTATSAEMVATARRSGVLQRTRPREPERAGPRFESRTSTCTASPPHRRGPRPPTSAGPAPPLASCFHCVRALEGLRSPMLEVKAKFTMAAIRKGLQDLLIKYSPSRCRLDIDTSP